MGAAQVAGTAEHVVPTGMEHSAGGVSEQESAWQALTPEGCFDTPRKYTLKSKLGVGASATFTEKNPNENVPRPWKLR